MFFAKGEINMNNIYKVIWSKAKNCYVVASEIARSHTKSASGSEKIGGGTRRKLLASLMALSLLCGGLGVAEASVHVEESGVTYEVYTTGETYSKETANAKLDLKADKTDVATNTANIANLENNKLSKADASNTYATKADVNTELANKADKTYVDTELTKKADVTALGEYAKTADVNTELANKADQADLDTANGKITDLQNKTAKLSPDGTKLTDMTTVETGTLKVTGGISNDTGVITTLTDIDNSMKQTATNTGEIANLKTKTDGQQTAINGLNEKTTQISYDAANHITSVNGMKVGQQVDMGGKDIINAGALTATGKVTGDGVEAGTGAITGGSLTVTGKVTGNGVDAGTGDITTRGNVNGATLETTGNATIGGALTATGKVTGDGLAAGTGAITGGSLTVTGKVTGNGVDAGAGAITGGSLSVTGDTTLNKTDVNGALNVTGESNLKNTTVDGTLNVNKETKLNDKLTVTGEATFKDKVTMEKDLEVKGELKTDKISMKNTDTDAAGKHDSSTAITADYITHFGEVEASGVTTKSSFTHTEKGSETYAYKGDATDWTETRSDVTADGVKTEVKDSKGNRTNTSQTANEIKGFVIDQDGNSSTASQTAKGINGDVTDKDGNKTDMNVTATENSIQIQDKDGKNTNLQVNKMDSSMTEITNADGKKTTTKQTATDITNTAKDGTITNEANHIENTATTMKTTVTGQATENFNGGLDTNVTGKENHTVTGDQNIHVTGKQTNIVGGGQINNITLGQENNILTGDQKTTVSNGSIINKAENGNISNTATNVTNEGTESVTNKVRANEVKVSQDGVDIKAEAGKKITESVGTASRVVENDKITDKAADSTVTTENGKGTTFGKEGSTGTTNIYGDSIRTGTINAEDTTTAKLTAGAAAGADGGRLTVDASDGVKGSYKSGDYTSRSYILANTLKSGVDNGKEPTEDDFVGSRTDHYMDGNKAKLDETVKDADGSNVTNKKSTGTVTTITDGTTTTKTDQGVKDITNTAKNGTITNDAKDIVNIAKDTITNTAGTSITNQVNDSKVTTDANGTTFENNTPAVSDSGATTTKINGNQITTGRVNANELDVSDTDGNNKADLLVKAGEGVKASASDGNTTGSLDVKADGITTSITYGTDHNTVSSTLAGGTIFTNSEAAAPVTGASGAGTAVNTTIKGNTITTGKVTMDYAEVMKDLGVRGNANITGKTTTGSLEVTGTSTLKGEVTMESNATVKKDLKVEGTTTTKTLKVTENAEIDGNATIKGDVTAKSYKVGDKTYIDANGINANDQKITNVADGSISEGSKDAVNGGQLYGVKRDLEHQVDKVGANAAAMANLRPMEFDPSSKWNIAAAIGNYGSETAAALGAFYRPNDDVMVNLSTAFGTGENMVGGGVSVRLGKSGNKLSREENNALKAQVDDLTARMDALLSVLNPNMSKDFPDVPENHWAYEAVSRLAGNDIVQGYPDGEFHGERTMTRYEMAEIIYNALSRGAEAERELVEEFKPELQAMAASEKATAEKAEG